MSALSALPDARLVLASGSPRRSEMLRQLGVTFVVRPTDIDETRLPGEPPGDYVLRLAVAKARAGAEHPEADPREVVLAADTVVVTRGDVLGKPRDRAEARDMLTRLSAKEHEVLTGVAVAVAGIPGVVVERTRVRFAEMSPAEIDWYVDSGEPMDKAGAYGIQGLGALFVESLEGNYSNVVGLPLPLTYRLLRAAGFSLLAPPGLNRRT